MRIQASAMGVALALATVGGARADDVLFTISGGGKTATFELPLNPIPTAGILNYSFIVTSVAAKVGGVPVTFADVTFYHDGMASGGFLADGLFNFSGQQLYSGSENSPMFTPGSYQLVNVLTRKTETVTLTELFTDPPPYPPTVSIPEPSTWAMLLLGFVGLSFAGYRKAKTRTINSCSSSPDHSRLP
jgi:PEP-CTERM motif